MNQSVAYIIATILPLIMKTGVQDVFIAYSTDYDELDDMMDRNQKQIAEALKCPVLFGLREKDVLVYHTIGLNDGVIEIQVCRSH